MTSEQMTVVEISECFPNKFKPVTGEFILQHARALSKYCKVIMIVPVRYVPAKELLTLNPARLISGVSKWFSSLRQSKSFSEGNLDVIYIGYISLPRPYLEAVDNYFINFFFYDKLKSTLTKFRPDLIYCNWIRPWAELSGKLASDFRIPLVIDHHEDIPTLKKLFPDYYSGFLKSFEKADRIVVHSTVNKKELLDEKLALPEVTINYLGQNFNVTDNKKDFNTSKFKLICVSHLHERRKNIGSLIAAMLRLNDPGFELDIIGDGSLKPEYMSLTYKLNLQDRVSFKGSKSQDELKTILNKSDIFILPSFPEAFGVVLIEAMALGLPVITCKGNGGGEELKLLGYPAILVKPDSPDALADAITGLSSDNKQMSLMSEQGKSIVKKYFTWEKNAEATYEMLKSVIDITSKNNI